MFPVPPPLHKIPILPRAAAGLLMEDSSPPHASLQLNSNTAALLRRHRSLMTMSLGLPPPLLQQLRRRSSMSPLRPPPPLPWPLPTAPPIGASLLTLLGTAATTAAVATLLVRAAVAVVLLVALRCSSRCLLRRATIRHSTICLMPLGTATLPLLLLILADLRWHPRLPPTERLALIS